MTARVERAVRVVPGTIADRQDPGAGGERTDSQQSCLEGPQPKRVIDALRPESTTPPDVLKTTGWGVLNRPLEADPPHPDREIRQPIVRNRLSALKGGYPRGSLHYALPLINELEHHRGSLEILLLLYEMESEGDGSLASPSHMRRRLRIGQEAIDGALGCLAQLGLVVLDSQREFPFAKRYRLTQRGKALVERPLHSWSLVLLE